MKENNKGFTLVELIISFAILSLVSLIILGFVTSGTNLFRNISSDIKLQYEAQVAMAQLQEYIIDCNEGMTFDSATGTLYILNSTTSGTGKDYTLHTFQKIGDELYYDTQPVSRAVDNSLNFYAVDSVSYDPDLMASYVSGFDIYFEARGDISNRLITRAEVLLYLSRGGRSYTGEQSISPRNNVRVASPFESLADSLIPNNP